MEEFQAYEDGQVAGAWWAKHTASEKELDNLCAVHEAGGLDGHLIPNHLGWPGAVMNSIEPDGADERDNQDVQDFWESIDIKDPADEYCHGFVAGAVEVA